VRAVGRHLQGEAFRSRPSPGSLRYHFGVSTLVRHETSDDSDLDVLRTRLVELEATLETRSAEVVRVEAELSAFKITYRREVGSLHEQLEKLELEIAEAELGERAKRVGDEHRPSSSPAQEKPAPLPRFTSDAVRKLFRDVAKTIHPDLARDELARDRRHALMIEANRAYALGDEEQLRWILNAWEHSPEAVQGNDFEATRLRLVRRVAEIERQLETLEADLAELTASPTWKLKAMVDEAAAKGKDLVRDTVRRLDRDIMVATNRLHAMRPPQ
jgi:predicted nucleotidyltransferase